MGDNIERCPRLDVVHSLGHLDYGPTVFKHCMYLQVSSIVLPYDYSDRVFQRFVRPSVGLDWLIIQRYSVRSPFSVVRGNEMDAPLLTDA